MRHNETHLRVRSATRQASVSDRQATSAPTWWKGRSGHREPRASRSATCRKSASATSQSTAATICSRRKRKPTFLKARAGGAENSFGAGSAPRSSSTASSVGASGSATARRTSFARCPKRGNAFNWWRSIAVERSPPRAQARQRPKKKRNALTNSWRKVRRGSTSKTCPNAALAHPEGLVRTAHVTFQSDFSPRGRCERPLSSCRTPPSITSAS